MIRENDMVYICSPLSAPTADEIRANMELARSYMQLVSKVFQCRAVAPHAYLPASSFEKKSRNLDSSSTEVSHCQYRSRSCSISL